MNEPNKASGVSLELRVSRAGRHTQVLVMQPSECGDKKTHRSSSSGRSKRPGRSWAEMSGRLGNWRKVQRGVLVSVCTQSDIAAQSSGRAGQVETRPRRLRRALITCLHDENIPNQLIESVL